MRDLRRSARRCTCLLALGALGLLGLPASAVALTQTITFTSTPPNPGIVGGPAYTVTATGGGSNMPVTFTIDASSVSVCSIEEATVSFKAPGECIIDANQPGEGEFEAAPEERQKVSVKRGQAITFTSPLPKPARVGATYTVEAIGGGSGNPVTFTIDPSSESVCRIGSGSTIEFVAVGECTIEAHQEGNNEYAPATVQLPVKVEKGVQAIAITVASPQPPVVGGPPSFVSATSASGLTIDLASASPSVCAVAGGTISFIAAGTCTITASQQGDQNWEPAQPQQASFAVGRGFHFVTFTSAPPSSAVVGGSAYTVAAADSVGLPVSFASATPSVCTLSGATVSFIGAGTCTVVAGQAGNENYNPAAGVLQSFTVHAVPVAVAATFKAISATLHSPSFKITLKEQVTAPGTLSWVLTFPNATFGVFGSATKPTGKGKCKAGSMRLSGKCRPKRVTYGRGSMTFATAGIVTIIVKPSAAAKQALRTAMRRKRNMRITAVLTFKPSNGDPLVTHTQLLTVNLSGAK